jgi:Transposase DDE domain
VRFRYQLHPKRAVGDTTYGTIDNIRTLEDAGIRAYVPLPNWDRTEFYGPSQFHYDAEQDEYRCPQGQTLRRKSAKFSEGVVVYQARAATCNACPVKEACTPSEHGRKVQRSTEAAYLDKVRAYHETAAYQKAMRKRAVWIEPLFGEAKQWHGLRKFRLRGLVKVNDEALLTAAGQNLKRLVAAGGWGRRRTPCGDLLAVPESSEQTDVIIIVVAVAPLSEARPALRSGRGLFWAVRLQLVCWLTGDSVRAQHQPATLFQRAVFFTDAPDMGNIVMLRYCRPPRGIVIALVQAQVLRRIRRGLGTLHHYRLQGRIQQLGIVPVGPVHHRR